ncbi:tail fiber protein [Mucilaginibacter sp. ZT4R22]|uniref:Tail fiber protein n=1 Tax=Mucilaginibacter pankratovii TaxID=2772110 RepID=A0ABR7WJ16_9SPHI|nr:phage tail protein [Mucilaginibacter pankratovii]MBD1362321.1 tail fiber protein [Mucilaginibacter pankratovii]
MENTINEIGASVSSPINIWPIGMMVPFSGNAETAAELNQQGWYLCNGVKLKRNQYPRLFDVLGHSCGGEGDEFSVPDMRGTFLRGVDVEYGQEGTERDPGARWRMKHNSFAEIGNKVLSRQNEEIRKHQHVTAKGSQFVRVEKIGMTIFPLVFSRFQKAREGKAIFTTETGNSEMRPVNVSVNYIIFAGLPASSV